MGYMTKNKTEVLKNHNFLMFVVNGDDKELIYSNVGTGISRGRVNLESTKLSIEFELDDCKCSNGSFSLTIPVCGLNQTLRLFRKICAGELHVVKRGVDFDEYNPDNLFMKIKMISDNHIICNDIVDNGGGNVVSFTMEALGIIEFFDI